MEVCPNPLRRARRSYGSRQGGRQGADEVDRAHHGLDALAQRANRLLLTALEEFRRQSRADPRLDCSDELLAAEPHIMFQRLFDLRLVAEFGQQLGEGAIALE